MKSVVSIVRALPEDILDVYGKALDLAECIPQSTTGKNTYVLPDMAWDKFIPGGGTLPWQLEGALLTLLANSHSYQSIRVLYPESCNDEARSAYKNDVILNKYGFQANTGNLVSEGLVSQEENRSVPLVFLSTFKTHVIQHYAASLWHLLTAFDDEIAGATAEEACKCIQEIAKCRSAFSNSAFLLDLTAAGEGPGPFCIRDRYPGLVMASNDPVALDAVAISLTGENPMDVPIMNAACKAGFGEGDLNNIEIVGELQQDVHLDMRNWIMPFPRGLVAALENKAITLPQSLMGKVARVVRKELWYRFRGSRRARNFMHNEWGMLWQCF